jgi:hypothetical protein
VMRRAQRKCAQVASAGRHGEFVQERPGRLLLTRVGGRPANQQIKTPLSWDDLFFASDKLAGNRSSAPVPVKQAAGKGSA